MSCNVSYPKHALTLFHHIFVVNLICAEHHLLEDSKLQPYLENGLEPSFSSSTYSGLSYVSQPRLATPDRFPPFVTISSWTVLNLDIDTPILPSSLSHHYFSLQLLPRTNHRPSSGSSLRASCAPFTTGSQSYSTTAPRTSPRTSPHTPPRT